LYIYDANGVKWLKQYYSGSSVKNTMYVGSFVYDDASGTDNYILDYILHADGKIEMTGGIVNNYEYHIKDHLGNTRVSFNAGSSVPLQNPDYYPFGMNFASSQGGDNKYLYNGKEMQDEIVGSENLDWYDYGARFYDPQLGRWHSVDPAAELMNSWSPYNYTFNNPVKFTDPDGTVPDWFENEITGEAMNVKGESSLPATEEAKGYVRMGEDDMFGEENTPDGPEGTVTRMSAEESTEFMSDNGYSFETKGANVVEVVDKQYHAEGDGLIILEVQVDIDVNNITGTYTKDSYVQTGYTDSGKVTKSDINIKTTTVRETSYSTRTYEYGPRVAKAGKETGKFGKQVIPWGKVGENLQKFAKKIL
jgi:RHS repeat-associated protein